RRSHVSRLATDAGGCRGRLDAAGESQLGELSLAARHPCAALELPRHELLPFTADSVVTRYSLVVVALIAATGSASAQDAAPFPAPKTEPPIVTPGRTNADPPSDAIVLFNGKDLSQWRGADGGAAKWNVRDGYVEVAPGTGEIATAQR